ncbi:unnamed protein product [Moneuplotes crassus]|uniref:Uncharacterized protein n=1 Tax=Euplotes crassus TaxID=5936 RepID=A0AAD1U014_EUPCR|nr:unnamed protein product [Moneuplotes crassus]
MSALFVLQQAISVLINLRLLVSIFKTRNRGKDQKEQNNICSPGFREPNIPTSRNIEQKSYMRRTFSSRMKSRDKPRIHTDVSKSPFNPKNPMKKNTDFEEIMKNFDFHCSKVGMMTPGTTKNKRNKMPNLSTTVSAANLKSEANFFGTRKTPRVTTIQKQGENCGTRSTKGLSLASPKFDNYMNNGDKGSKTIKAISSKKDLSCTDNLSTKGSSRPRKKVNLSPFNLSSSNKAKKFDNKSESLKRHNFKARKIPKSHKVPFMVFHSTKDLTCFRKPGDRKDSENRRTKVVVKTPYDELCNVNNDNEKSPLKTLSINEVTLKCNKTNDFIPKIKKIKDLGLTDLKVGHEIETKNKGQDKMDTIDERENSYDSEDSCAKFVNEINTQIAEIYDIVDIEAEDQQNQLESIIRNDTSQSKMDITN